MNKQVNNKNESKTIKVNGKNVSYYYVGQGEPLVLIHGWLGCKETYLDIMEKLDKKFTVIVPDLPGFGDSEPYEVKYSFNVLSDFVNSFCIQLGIRKYNALGNSLGGNIALDILERYPEHLKKVITRATAFSPKMLNRFFSGSVAKKIWEKSTNNSFNLKLFRKFFLYGLKKLITEQNKDNNLAQIAIEKTNRINSEIARDLGLELLNHDYSEVLLNTDKDVLILNYDKDFLVAKKDIVKTILNSNIKTIRLPGGHSLLRDETDNLVKIIENFIL